ncbi:alpha/beta fold hydrolase [Streptomyces arenae]|uniref:alpha/beta fold hydrolase n=1 Tax=Streptomyces arenae TaxID=29301 RepID=UPI00265859B6|nr:alpha/beta hydrolase [Streptomyces arenae]MCG7207410.1 alpha/beta hydrolase [Streptomyces arenae]
MTYIRVDDNVRLFVQDMGGAGRPVVLIPGFGMDHRVWARQAENLSGTHRVLCIDQRGHGLSDKPYHGYEIAQLAQDLLTALRRLDVNDCILVGWSFGGQVAFRAAAEEPRRIARLALVSSNGVRASRSADFPFGRLPEELEGPLISAERSNQAAARRQTISSGFRRTPDPQTLERLVQHSLAMPSWAAIACYRSMLHTSLLADLPKVTMPVLQIIGADDPVHSTRGAHWLNEQLHDARLIELDGCGHYPMIESAQEFDAALAHFVSA